jgi:hypothetical protein
MIKFNAKLIQIVNSGWHHFTFEHPLIFSRKLINFEWDIKHDHNIFMKQLFNFFKRNKSAENGVKTMPEISDLEGVALKEGDLVEVLRYEMGTCKIIIEDGKYFYESITTGEKVSWAKMIDAATNFQKVRKIK